MIEIEAPAAYTEANLFLAGGITGARNWQRDAIMLLQHEDGTLLNPRRSVDFRAEYADEQVEWEHKALQDAEAILFWFPPETLCPITLFELGMWSMRPEKPIFVGTDRQYQRRFDVVKQLSLSNPWVTVYDTLEDTVGQYLRWRVALREKGEDTRFKRI